MNSNNLNFIAPSSPTYCPAGPNKILADILDFFVSSGLGPIHPFATTLYDLFSDHSPVLLTIDISPISSPRPPTLTPRPMDWDKCEVFFGFQDKSLYSS